MSDARHGWKEIAIFSDIVILSEAAQHRDTATIMEGMVKKLELASPQYSPWKTMTGCILQARGDVAGAVQAYKDAGVFFDFGDEYLQTAKGYEVRGDPVRAWRDASVSKFMWPGNPEVHKWMARQLRVGGRGAEAEISERIDRSLEGKR